jgi:DNA-binding winged helix-turn-helix (wHTH) protein
VGESTFTVRNYTIDPLRRMLRCDGEPMAIEPKAFDCLVYLAQQRGRAVSKNELIGAVWGKAEVSDAMLGQAVLKARRALGDQGRSQVTIRTVRSFGYEWIEPLSEGLTATPHVQSDQAMLVASTEKAGPSFAIPAVLALAAAGAIVIWTCMT